MSKAVSLKTLNWIALGLFVGLAISYVTPKQKLQAVTTDRDSKFALATTKVAFADDVEGIFVLDFLTGQLRGAVLNPRKGKFSHAYFRNIAADFQVDPKGEPHYAIVAGKATLPSVGRNTMSSGVIYIAELTSGKVICYGFPYNPTRGVAGPIAMIPLDTFPFREAVAGN